MATPVYMSEQGRIVSWRKNEGDSVRANEVLGEVEVNQVEWELNAPDSGVLRKCFVSVGDTRNAGTLIAIIAGAGEDISALIGGAAVAQAPSVQEVEPAAAVNHGAPDAGISAAAAAGADHAAAAPAQTPMVEPAPAAPVPAPATAEPAAAAPEPARVKAPPMASMPPREAGTQEPRALDEFLAARAASGERSELVDGRVVVLGTPSFSHGEIHLNLSSGLHQKLRGTGCRVMPQGMLVRPGEREDVLLPDVAVVCQAPQREVRGADQLLLNPAVVIEVLSAPTADYDQGTKWRKYRESPSLQDYLLVADDEPRVERYTRQQGGGWLFSEVRGLQAEVRLESLNVSLTLAEIYEGVLTADGPSA